MRINLLSLLAAAALLLAACSGDDPPPQTEQPQPSPPAAAQQSQAAQTQPAATPTDQQPQPTAQPQQPADPLFAQAWAAYEAWAESLETMELAVAVDMQLAGEALQLELTVLAQLQPFTVLAAIDSALFPAADPLSDEPGLTMLLSDDAIYLTMPGLGGWIDQSADAEAALDSLSGMLSVDPSELADLEQYDQALSCYQIVGGAITEGQHNGQPVWFIDCLIDLDTLDHAARHQLSEQGVDLAAAGLGFESMTLRLAISQTSGAPLLSLVDVAIRDPFGLASSSTDSDPSDEQADAPTITVALVSHLLSWNEPLAFPIPEPLVDASLLEAAARDGAYTAPPPPSAEPSSAEPPPEMLSIPALIELASRWEAAQQELHLEMTVDATIDGLPHQAATIVRGSRSQGAFETIVTLDNAGRFRLLWNRDGIWISDAETAAGPVWERSNPALLGFAGQTVDEFLAAPDRLNLQPLYALSSRAWIARTIEGGNPAVYELGIDTGPREPGMEFFDEVVQILRHDLAELLAESVEIQFIDHFETIITFAGEDGQFRSRQTTATLDTSAGPIEFTAATTLHSTTPPEFSNPDQ